MTDHASPQRQWTILAPVADFDNVEDAGHGEDRVDWFDPDAAARQEACTLGFAALEIAESLNQVEGESAVTAAWTGQPPETPFVVLLTPASRNQSRSAIDEACPDLATPQAVAGFTITTIDHDGHTDYVVLGGSRIGTLYGAYELLDRLGFRWFSPDPWDAIQPTEMPVGLPAIEASMAPSFDSRGFQGQRRADAPFLLWMARNRMNKWGVDPGYEAFCRKTGILWLGGGHGTFGRYLPAAQYFDDHPEWYGLRDGKRSPKVHEGMGDNICLSNPEARAEVARNAVADLVDGDHKDLDIIQLWPFDHYDSWCECEACAALGNKIDHLLLLAHDVRQAIRGALDDGRLNHNVRVSVCAYHQTLPPPSRPLPETFDHDNIIVQVFVIERCYAHTLDDPRCTEANAKLLEILRGWTSPECAFKGHVMVGEYYNVSTFAGMSVPFMHIMGHDLPMYRSIGVADIDYMHVLVNNWGTHALTNSQFAATIWNTELDTDAWLQDFFSKRYADLAGPMRAFYDTLQAAMRNCKPLKHYMGVVDHGTPEKIWPLPDYRIASLNRTLPQAGSPENPTTIFDCKHLGYAPDPRDENDGPSILETLDLLHEASAMLDEVILQCDDKAVAPRLAADARRLRYTHHFVQFIHRLVRVRMLENRGQSALVKAEAHALHEVARMLEAETLMPRNFKSEQLVNGLTATFLPKAYEAVMQRHLPELVDRTDADPGRDIHPQ